MTTATVKRPPRWKMREIERKKKKLYQKRKRKEKELKLKKEKERDKEKDKTAAHNTLLIRVRGIKSQEGKALGIIDRIKGSLGSLFKKKTRQK